MSSLRIAIISDLHCHRSDQGNAESLLLCDKLGDHRINNPVKSLIKLIKDGGLEADMLLLPGDFANKICQEGLKTGWALCKEIGRELKVKDVFATLGNHDVDFHDVTISNPFVYVKELGDDFPTSNAGANNDFWHKGYCIVEGDLWRLLIINTTHFYFNPECVRHGEVTSSQINGIDEVLKNLKDKDFKMVLAHHPPIIHDRDGSTTSDVIYKADDLLQMLEQNGFKYFFHGHKHDARLSYSPLGANSALIFSAASLTSISKQHDKLNGFHIVTLDTAYIDSCIDKGRIDTWTYLPNDKWLKQYNKSFPPFSGFGYRGVIPELADKIYNLLSVKENKTASWDIIISNLPQIDYLLPQDLAKIISYCKTRYNIETDVLVDNLSEIKALSIIE